VDILPDHPSQSAQDIRLFKTEDLNGIENAGQGLFDRHHGSNSQAPANTDWPGTA